MASEQAEIDIAKKMEQDMITSNEKAIREKEMEIAADKAEEARLVSLPAKLWSIYNKKQ